MSVASKKPETNHNFYQDYKSEHNPLYNFTTFPPHFLFYQHVGDEFSSDCPLSQLSFHSKKFFPSEQGRFKFSNTKPEALKTAIENLHDNLIPFLERGELRKQMIQIARVDGGADFVFVHNELMKLYNNTQPNPELFEKITVLHKFFVARKTFDDEYQKEFLRTDFINDNVIAEIQTEHPAKWKQYQAARKGRSTDQSQQQSPKYFHFTEFFHQELWSKHQSKDGQKIEIQHKHIVNNYAIEKAYGSLDSKEKQIFRSAIDPYMYLSCSPEELPGKVEDFYQQLAEKLDSFNSQYDPIYAAAMFCVEYNDLHTKNNGNGRISRIVPNLILMQAGIMPVCFDNNEEYTDVLIAAQRQKDSDIFAKFLYNKIEQINELYKDEAKYNEQFPIFPKDKILEIDFCLNYINHLSGASKIKSEMESFEQQPFSKLTLSILTSKFSQFIDEIKEDTSKPSIFNSKYKDMIPEAALPKNKAINSSIPRSKSFSDLTIASNIPTDSSSSIQRSRSFSDYGRPKDNVIFR